MHISHSLMNTARTCWKRFEFQYIEHIEPIVPNDAQILGRIIHEALDHYYNGMSEEKVEYFIHSAFDSHKDSNEVADSERFDYLKSVAIGMWISFPKDRHKFSEIQSEKKFNVDLSGVNVTGAIDGLVSLSGKKWVREFKTTSMSFDKYRTFLNYADQTLLYTWALSKMGIEVSGVMYDIIHKPLLRKGANESASDFHDRIILEYKDNPKKYHQREYIYVTPQRMKLFVEDLGSFIDDMNKKRLTSSVQNPYWRNVNACYTMAGECPFTKICFETDSLTKELYYKKREGPWEKTQENQK